MIDKKLTAYLAELGKIELTDTELAEVTEDMKNIIALMDKVREFDGRNAPYTLDAAIYDDLRTDEEQASYSAEKITSNAAEIKNNCFTVPKVV